MFLASSLKVLEPCRAKYGGWQRVLSLTLPPFTAIYTER